MHIYIEFLEGFSIKDLPWKNWSKNLVLTIKFLGMPIEKKPNAKFTLNLTRCQEKRYFWLQLSIRSLSILHSEILFGQLNIHWFFSLPNYINISMSLD
jgi:hypothetical protein